MIDNLLYFFFSSGTTFPLQFFHEHRAMEITLHKDEEVKEIAKALTLFINGVNFNELPPTRAREPLARSKATINMSGYKK